MTTKTTETTVERVSKAKRTTDEIVLEWGHRWEGCGRKECTLCYNTDGTLTGPVVWKTQSGAWVSTPRKKDDQILEMKRGYLGVTVCRDSMALYTYGQIKRDGIPAVVEEFGGWIETSELRTREIVEWFIKTVDKNFKRKG